MIQDDVLASNMYIYTIAIQCFQTTSTLQKREQNTVRRRALPTSSNDAVPFLG